MFNKASKVGTVSRSAQSASQQSKIPAYFMCPISLDIMEDPTISQCGHLFDKESIIRWIRDPSNKQACPLCHKRILEATLAPCFPLKQAIADFKQQQAGGSDSGLNEGSGKPNVLISVSKKMKDMKLFANKGGEQKEDQDQQVVPQTQRRQKVSTQQFNGSGNNLAESPKSLQRDVGRQADSRKPQSSSKVGRIWARLTPLLDMFGEVELNKDEFTFGRADGCDRKFDASEISNVHCSIYRVKRDDSLEYDYFVEDRSTNGTFVNGHRVGKGLIASIIDQDEISMGEKFTSRTVPKLVSFVDWVFANIELTSERRADVDRLKNLPSFYDLIEIDDNGLRQLGVRSEYVRSKILNAIRNWVDKYRFPAFRFELIKKVHGSVHGSAAQVSGTVGRQQPENEMSEVSFEPSTYTEKSLSGVACLYIRRVKGSRGAIVLSVKTTDKGTVKLGTQFQAFNQRVLLPDGETEAVVEFYWRSDVVITGITTICFEVKVISGKAFVGRNNSAVLIIETPSKARPKSDRAAQNDPNQMMLQSAYDQMPVAPPKNNKQRNQRSPEDSGARQDQDMLALMMESFPTLDAKEILKIIHDERQMMGQLNDRGLLQDLVVIKLTNLARGNALDLNYSNIRMTHTSSDERDDQEESDQFPVPMFAQPTFGLGKGGNWPQQSQPQFAGSGMKQDNHQQFQEQNVAQQQPDQPPVNKIRQTILRRELEGFLLMASISLIRKFFSIQGVDNNVTHIQSPIVETSVALADAFLRSMVDGTPQLGITPDQDVFEFDRVVEQFKKYVYTNGSDLRTKAIPLSQEAVSEGYRYEVSFQKSAHHVKMENNHAVIEDLNTFAKFGGSQTSFYGVFDGHGGYLVSEYLSLHLAGNIAKNPLFQKNIAEAIRQGYQSTDDAILQKMKRDNLRGGSTAVTAFLRDNVISVAWVGDARCIVFRKMGDNLVAFPLTTEHHPQGTEKSRIIKMGGFVDHVAGKWRVNGRLAVSRSFGDDNLKPVVSAEPDIAKFSLMGDEHFLLLSCDGLYDVMEYSDVAGFLDEKTSSGCSLAEITQSLVEEGQIRGSTDDITVMLVDLARQF